VPDTGVTRLAPAAATGAAGITDPVSGAYSRALLDARLGRDLARARQTSGDFALCLLDIDHFKTVNDAFGHARGDAVLRQVVERVLGLVRGSDALFRFGGDEFVLLLPDTDASSAFDVAERIATGLRQTAFPGDPPLAVSASIGVAAFPTDATDAVGLLAAADRRSYSAKRRGRGCAVADDAGTDLPNQSPRLIERDAALAAAQLFLDQLLAGTSGTFVVRGDRGAGHTRFTAEVAKIAQLQGVRVVAPAPADCPLPAYAAPNRGPRPHGVGVTQPPAVLIVADTAGSWSAAIDRVASLVEADASPPAVGLVLAGSGATEEPLPAAMPLLGSADLATFTANAMRVWLRAAVQGEPSAKLVEWVAARGHGLPARAERALARLVARGGLVQAGSGHWTLTDDAAAAARPARRLPTVLTDLVGRARECEAVLGLLRSARLVNLVGPGGIGKTRLSLAVAMAAEDEFDDGVTFVPLADATTTPLVASAIAKALGIIEMPGRPIVDTMTEQLADQRMLLVLDNFEQVLVAAPLVAQLLAAAPGLSVLTSSRERLKISREQVYQVPPLTLPSLDQLPVGDLEVARAAASFSALGLFAARARAASYGFRLTGGNVAAVAELCTRLDGLPLAIELAAARCDSFGPEELLAQLGGRLDLLADGPRDVPVRQQTLRAAIDWSVALLDPADDDVFTQLGVFAGGCSLAAAVAVCGSSRPPGTPGDLPTRLSTLVGKSLLRTERGPDGTGRFRMLETTHAYAVERLAANPIASSTLRARHAAYYMSFAEQANEELRGVDRATWIARVETEYANLRAALQWSLDAGDVETAARTALGLYRFWNNGHHVADSRPWLEQILAAPGPLAEPLRVRVLDNAAWLAVDQGDHEPARQLAAQCLEAALAVGDDRAVAEAIWALGDIESCTGAYNEARAHYQEALRLCRETGDRPGVATALGQLAEVDFAVGDLGTAFALASESLQLEREAEHPRGITQALNLLGSILLTKGDPIAARAMLEESLALCHSDRQVVSQAAATLELARVASAEDDQETAAGFAISALGAYRRLGLRMEIAAALELLAQIVVDIRPLVAATLFGAAERLREQHRLPRPPVWQPSWDAAVHRLRQQLADGPCLDAWAAGGATKLDAVVTEALAIDPAICRPPS
jgi:diguanylate cyclase (GGDEF)-like protein